jgi:hypothetical protein
MNKAKNMALEAIAPLLIFFIRMKTMDEKITLPAAIAHYIEASNRFDPDSAAACFSLDATVRDEGHTHIGREAIRTWVSEASEKYRPHATVINAQEHGDKLVLDVRVAGEFPGSPIELKFQFSLRNDAIAQLTILPAN